MARRTLHLPALLIVGAALVACSVVALTALSEQKAEATFPGKNGRIAFDSGAGIHTMSSTGENVKRLTSLPLRGSSPAYSPNGKKIAFSEWSGLRDDIYVMNADGSNKRLLTDERKLPGEGMVDRYPAFSPSGRQIVFQRGRGQWDYDLYRINLDGSNLRPVFRSPKPDEQPAWSPDGRRIAFLHGNRVATVRPDGTGLTVLRQGFTPDWSPDGSQLTFAADEGSRASNEIYKMNSDGTEVTQLTNPERVRGGISATNPAFSPGGGKIAFHDGRDGDGDIYKMNADGSGEVKLTHNKAHDSAPAWQPVQ